MSDKEPTGYAVVLIDRGNSKIYQFNKTSLDKYKCKIEVIENTERKLFDKTLEMIRACGQIVICGTGVSGYHFQTYLREHYPSVFRRVINYSFSEFLSDLQVIDIASKTFSIAIEHH